MENDPRKRKNLSDHALELIMGDVLHGLRGLSLDMQADTATAMASTQDHDAASAGMKSAMQSEKK